MSLTIRKETPEDLGAVYEVVKKAFEKEVYSDHDEQNLVNRLRKSAAFVADLSLVAEFKGQVVGHILFTEIQIGQATGLGLAPVSVAPNHQGKGIGSKLIEAGHALAKDLGYTFIVLLGHADYYPRFGYHKASQFGVLAPFDVPDESFMVLELVEGALDDVEGMVVYDPAFFETDSTK